MNKRRYRAVLLPWAVYVFLVGGVCLVSGAASCKLSPAEFTMLSGEYSPPRLEQFVLTGTRQAVMVFSCQVEFPRLDYEVLSASESPQKDSLVSSLSPASSSGENRYEIVFPADMKPGINYVLSGTVRDAGGSTLSFSLGFTGYNDRVPRMVFSEVNIKPAATKKEFVEFFVLEDGNVGGMILSSGYDGTLKDYVFPAAEVKAGEYLVVHMQIPSEGGIDETGSNLNLASGGNSSPEGRDLWVNNTSTRLGEEDVLLLRERLNGKLLDALMYARSNKKDWPKELITVYAREAFEAGIWIEGLEIEFALCVDKATSTRTLSRQNIAAIRNAFNQGTREIFPVKSSDWIIVKTKNATPGKPNSSAAHTD